MIVKLCDLSYFRESKKILNNINLNIQKGKITSIMGPSGCGKTTLLKLISGELFPFSGKIILDGFDLSVINKKKLYDIRKNIGMLYQNCGLFSDMNVFDNVAFPVKEHTNLSNDMIRDLVLIKLHAVGLRGAKYIMPFNLSGGMARRVALARAMVLDPKLIMYDEPFAGLDPISIGVLLKLIKVLNDTLNMTTILVSHDIYETVSISDYIYLIFDGCIIAHGSSKDIMRLNNMYVNQFMKGLYNGPIGYHYSSCNYKNDLLNYDI
ncbi:MAG: ATP-binding cassette domain-containing protein [Candidatus Azosocius agrarius]|nr:MAG: ATP-binding cassette domain-containing protein [Gammaproteobacteria bacterium]